MNPDDMKEMSTLVQHAVSVFALQKSTAICGMTRRIIFLE
jgi:hypothetical protein